jgi:hypothetical protein
MATATATTVTVQVNPNSTQLQSDIIGPATAVKAGVMTTAQVEKLDAVAPATADVAVTTSVSAVTATTIAIPLGKTVFIEAKIAALKSDGSQGAAYIERAAFRNNGGVVSQIGLTSTDFIVEDDPSWVGGDYAISGTNVLATVAGKAGTTINWSVDVVTHTAGA